MDPPIEEGGKVEGFPEEITKTVFFFFLIRSSTTTWAFPGPSAGRRWEAKHLQAPRRVTRRGSPRLSGGTAFSARSAHAGRLPLPARSQAAAPA